MIDIPLILFAFSVGLAAFFANICGFFVLPAFLGQYFAKDTDSHKKGFTIKNVAEGISVGLIATLGFMTVFVALGTLLSIVSRQFLSLIPQYLLWFNYVLGTLLIVLGLAFYFGKSFAISIPISKIKLDTNLSFYGFGVVYAITSFGCVLPLFVSILTLALSTVNPVINVPLIFLFYSLGMGLSMITATVLVSVSKGFLLDWIRKNSQAIKKFAAFLLILLGIYLIKRNIELSLFV